MAEKLGTCAICGAKYSICRTCTEVVQFKPWRTIVDTAEHYKIHIILSDYTNRRITKDEAKSMLGNCNIKDYKCFLPHIAKVIDEILKDNKKMSAKPVASKKDEVPAEDIDKNKNSE